jgi:hypothetical protein
MAKAKAKKDSMGVKGASRSEEGYSRSKGTQQE